MSSLEARWKEFQQAHAKDPIETTFHLDPVQIEPATGEAKTAVETSCQAILQKEVFDSKDVDTLARNMVELLGGTMNYFGYLESNPLIDAQRSASTAFHADMECETFYGYIDYNDNRREQIFHTLGEISIYTTINHSDLKYKFKYPSYFEGAKASVFSKDQEWREYTVGGPTSAKPFFQKAFEVYQASQQPAQ